MARKRVKGKKGKFYQKEPFDKGWDRPGYTPAEEGEKAARQENYKKRNKKVH